MSKQDKKPLVSVFVITYKHEQYIAKCLDNIISQVTNFDFEIVVGEDYSPDNTRSICKEYANQYPDLINLLPSTENIGAKRNGIRTFQACSGKYIAMCEGDDYWCDNYKLQKQVDFLEANPDFTICFSPVKIVDEMNWDSRYEFYFSKLTKDVFTIEDFICAGKNIIPTPSMMFKNVLPDPYPAFFVNAIMGDIPVQLFAGDKGKAKCMDEIFAVYRNHAGGNTKTPEAILNGEAGMTDFFNGFNEFTDYKYDKAFKKRYCNIAKVNLLHGSSKLKGHEKFKNYLKWFPEYIKSSEKVNIREAIYYHLVLFSPGLLRLIGGKKNEPIS